jgi:DNA anti-recombination protein RmuC
MNNRLDQMDQNMNNRLNQMDQNMNNRLDQMDQNINNRLDQISERLDKVSASSYNTRIVSRNAHRTVYLPLQKSVCLFQSIKLVW